MQWSDDELRVLSEDDCGAAITSLLQKLMVREGRIDLKQMGPTNIQYAIHLLRGYGAMENGERVREVLHLA